MSETVCTSGVETRQSMIRVWMAISAVWVAFWLLIALVVAAADLRTPLQQELGLFSLIVLIPPLTLLTLGAGARLIFEVATRKR